MNRPCNGDGFLFLGLILAITMANQSQGFWQPQFTVNPSQYSGLPNDYNLYPISPQYNPQTGTTSSGGYLYGQGSDPNAYSYSSNLYPYMVPSKIIPAQRSQTISQAVSPAQFSVNGGPFLSASDPMGQTIYGQPSSPQSTQSIPPQQQGYTFGSNFLAGSPSSDAPWLGIQGTNNFIQQQPSWATLNQSPQGLGTLQPWNPNLTALQNQSMGK